MNNIKAYTDIEQSKKLAEILPIGFDYADFEIKKLIAPVFNHFYDKYDVSRHEEMMYSKGRHQKRSVAIVKGYKAGKKAVFDYIANAGRPLCLYSDDEELMEVFENAFLSVVEF